MKHTTLFLLALVLAETLCGQSGYQRTHNKMLDEAQLLLAAGDHLEAAKIYQRLVRLDTSFAEVSYELGLCYLSLPGAWEKAVPLFERSARQGHTEAVHQLALCRHRASKFDEAIDLFNRYKQIHHRAEPDAHVDDRIAMVRNAKRMVRQPVDLSIRNMGPTVNSPSHDYCPLVTSDGDRMYFTSRREGTIGSRRDPSGQYFEDIYTAIRTDGVWSNAVNVGRPLNSDLQDATVGLAPDGASMIVYRTSDDLVSGDLFESRQENGAWSEPMIMTERINSPSHEPSASISPDGNEIYFTSDRPGGFGGRDLYRIRRLPNGEWSLPLNLGPTINSPYDEDAPFIHSDGMTLFFSSNSPRSMGGYDVFKSTLLNYDDCSWSDPENMGYPLNTVNDDIYFCLSEDGTTGYFSSERNGGLGAQDIYQVEFPSNQLTYLIVRGVVMDALDMPVKARIMLTDPSGEEIVGIYNTDQHTGRYLMVLEPGERYSLQVEAPGHEVVVEEIHAMEGEGAMEMSHETRLSSLDASSRLSDHGR